jgi:hypothetical protein
MDKPIAYVVGYHDGYPVVQPVDGAAVLPVGMALYDHQDTAMLESVLDAMENVPHMTNKDDWDSFKKALRLLRLHLDCCPECGDPDISHNHGFISGIESNWDSCSGCDWVGEPE